ncbi:hypothetical protein LEMLEM_LOCUS1750 [Lemmus lemmus]
MMLHRSDWAEENPEFPGLVGCEALWLAHTLSSPGWKHCPRAQGGLSKVRRKSTGRAF